MQYDSNDIKEKMIVQYEYAKKSYGTRKNSGKKGNFGKI